MNDLTEFRNKIVIVEQLEADKESNIFIKICDLDDYKDILQNIRYIIFTEELEYYEKNTQKKETDKFDKDSINILLKHRDQFIGYCRILPIQYAQFKRAYFIFQKNDDLIEITRLGLLKNYRGKGFVFSLFVGIYYTVNLITKNKIIATCKNEYLSMFEKIGAIKKSKIKLDDKHGSRNIFTLNPQINNKLRKDCMINLPKLIKNKTICVSYRKKDLLLFISKKRCQRCA